MLAGCIVICRTTELMPLTDAMPQAMVIVHLPVYASETIIDADKEWSSLTLPQPNELRNVWRSPSRTSPVPSCTCDRLPTRPPRGNTWSHSPVSGAKGHSAILLGIIRVQQYAASFVSSL
jgi:hypothetical protein